MSAVDRITVGEALPRIRTASFHDGHAIAVTWDDATRRGSQDIVDLAPLIFRLKFYGPLRDRVDVLSSVHVINEGSAIAWGSDGEIDMSAVSVLRLAEETMTSGDFTVFMKRHGFTFDRVAAELGISKRLAAYYAAGRTVPRYIAMACELIDRKAGPALPMARDHAADPATRRSVEVSMS